MLSVRSIASRAVQAAKSVSLKRAGYATVSDEKHRYKVVIVGAGEQFLRYLKLVLLPDHLILSDNRHWWSFSCQSDL